MKWKDHVDNYLLDAYSMVIILCSTFLYMGWQQRLFEYAKMKYATRYAVILERQTLLAEKRLYEEDWAERLQYCICYDI